MNSARKPRRLGIKPRRRKISSSSNHSQISFSQGSGANRRRLSALRKNNRDLATALGNAQRDLCIKDHNLKYFERNLNNMLLARFKMLEVKSGLEEALNLLEFDSTNWPVSKRSNESRKIFKDKMKNDIEAVKETSELDETVLGQDDGADRTETEDVTPKLFLQSSIFKSTANFEKCSNPCLLQVAADFSPASKDIPDAIADASVTPPVKTVTTSKIPISCDLIKKNKTAAFITPTKSKAYEGKAALVYANDETAHNSDRRKTFVIKKPEVLASASESSTQLYEKKDIVKKTIFDLPEVDEMTHGRKTFVIKKPLKFKQSHDTESIDYIVESQEPVQEFQNKNYMYDTRRRRTFILSGKNDASKQDGSEDKNLIACNPSMTNGLQNEVHNASVEVTCANSNNLLSNIGSIEVGKNLRDVSLQESTPKIDPNFKTICSTTEEATSKFNDEISNVENLSTEQLKLCINSENTAEVSDMPTKSKMSELNKIKACTILLHEFRIADHNTPVLEVAPGMNYKVSKQNEAIKNSYLKKMNVNSNIHSQIIENTSELKEKVTKSNETKMNEIKRSEHVVHATKSTSEKNDKVTDLDKSEKNTISHISENVRKDIQSSSENVQEKILDIQNVIIFDEPEQNMSENCEIYSADKKMSDSDCIFGKNKKVRKSRISKPKKSIKICQSLRNTIESTNIQMQDPEALSSCRRSKCISKEFLYSSNSENETVSDTNLDILKGISPTISYPAQKVLSKVNCHKAVAFGAKKEKPVSLKPGKKSRKYSDDKNEIIFQSNDKNVNKKNSAVDSENPSDISENQNKSVSFTVPQECLNTQVLEDAPEMNYEVSKQDSLQQNEATEKNYLKKENVSTQDMHTPIIENILEMNKKITKSNESDLSEISEDINQIKRREQDAHPTENISGINDKVTDLKKSEANKISHNVENISMKIQSSYKNLEEFEEIIVINQNVAVFEEPEQNLSEKNCKTLRNEINSADTKLADSDCISGKKRKSRKSRLSKQGKGKKIRPSLRNNIESTDNTQIREEQESFSSHRKSNCISYKFLLSSSDSENESISQLDLDDILKSISPIKSYPVRKVLSKVNIGKTVTYSAKNKKSVPPKLVRKSTKSKTTKKISQGKNETRFQSNDSHYDVKNNSTVVAKDLFDISDNQKKSVRFDVPQECLITANNVQRQTSEKDSQILGNVPKLLAIEENNVETLQDSCKTAHTDELNAMDTHAFQENFNPSSIYPYDDENINCNVQIENDYIDHSKTCGTIPKKHKKGHPATKNGKRKDVILEDSTPKKMSKRTGKENKPDSQQIVFDATITSFTDNYKSINDEVGKVDVNTKSKMGKKLPINTSTNTFVVEAEIHAPPPSIQTEALQNNRKEVSRRLSVVLNDVFKDVDKDVLLKCTSSFPLKTPFSSNLCNIMSTVDTIQNDEVQSTVDLQKLEEPKVLKVRRGRAGQKAATYKEPSLRKKMRR